MSVANLYWLPTVILLIVLVVAVAVSFVIIPSLRKYSHRRNWLIYAIIILLLSIIAFEAYDTSIGPPLVTYSFDTADNQFVSSAVNRFNITCTSLSNRQTSFNLIIEATNASLIVPSQLGYVQTNNNTIKIPFTLNGIQQTQIKPVQFTIDRNVSAFDFSCRIDYQNGGPIVTGAVEGLHCELNSTTNNYAISRICGPYV